MEKLTPQERKHALITFGILVIFLIAAVFFWSVFKWLFPALVVVEYITECIRFKTFYPPIVGNSVGWVKHKLPKRKPKIINSISKLLLRDFIQCIAYKNLSVLGRGTNEQLQLAFNDLYQQYLDAKRDESIKVEINVRKKLADLELRASIINRNCAILKERYSAAAINSLKRYYPNYTFSMQTLADDIKKVQIGEIKKGIQYDRLVDNLKSMRAGEKAGATGRQIEQMFVDKLASIEQLQKVSYNEDEMTVLKFARLEMKLHEHIKYLEKQYKKK